MKTKTPKPYVVISNGLAVRFEKDGPICGSLMRATRFERALEAHATACDSRLTSWRVRDTLLDRIVIYHNGVTIWDGPQLLSPSANRARTKQPANVSETKGRKPRKGPRTP